LRVILWLASDTVAAATGIAHFKQAIFIDGHGSRPFVNANKPPSRPRRFALTSAVRVEC